MSNATSEEVILPLKEFIKTLDNLNVDNSEETYSISTFFKKVVSFGSGNLDDLGVAAPMTLLEPESGLKMWVKRNVNPFIEIGGDDPIERMISVLKFQVANLAFIAHKMKKPLNPLISETYFSTFKAKNDEIPSVVYIAEQVSHHPPISAIYMSTANGNVQLHSTTFPKFTVGKGMHLLIKEQGSSIINIHSWDEVYEFGIPNIIVQPRATFFYDATVDLYFDGCLTITCKKSNLHVKINFAAKTFLRNPGTGITGEIYYDDDSGPHHDVLYTIGGDWKKLIWLKKVGTKKEIIIADNRKCPRDIGLVLTLPEKLEDSHSERVWSKVIEAMQKKDYKTASKLKKSLEQWQRSYFLYLKKNNLDHHPEYFKKNAVELDSNKSWIFKTEDFELVKDNANLYYKKIEKTSGISESMDGKTTASENTHLTSKSNKSEEFENFKAEEEISYAAHSELKEELSPSTSDIINSRSDAHDEIKAAETSEEFSLGSAVESYTEDFISLQDERKNHSKSINNSVNLEECHVQVAELFVKNDISDVSLPTEIEKKNDCSTIKTIERCRKLADEEEKFDLVLAFDEANIFVEANSVFSEPKELKSPSEEVVDCNSLQNVRKKEEGESEEVLVFNSTEEVDVEVIKNRKIFSRLENNKEVECRHFSNSSDANESISVKKLLKTFNGENFTLNCETESLMKGEIEAIEGKKVLSKVVRKLYVDVD
ncbi:hypothetical protein HDU92_003673 [Lobulomyces angularis]|nr:hypothetical protein HDU92_003673 [Lobulomyces angularis]